MFPARATREIRWLEGVKKSGLSQALVKRALIRKDLGDARLTVPAFFHTFLYPIFGGLERFHVSVGWTKKVSATFLRTGSAARPPASPPGRRGRFGPAIQQQLWQWIAEQPDPTLHELQARLRSRLDMAASIGRL